MKSIKFKIWLAFFITLTVCMATMLVVTHTTMKKGFLRYVNVETINKLDLLKNEIAEIYTRTGSLELFTTKPHLWDKLKYKAYSPYLKIRADQRRNDGPPTPPKSKELPPKDKHGVGRHQREFMERLILTDENKNVISGRYRKNSDYSWSAIKTEDKIIAYVGYVAPSEFLRDVDKHFLYNQLRALSKISIFLVIISFITVLIISHKLVKPLVALSRSAKQLAAGEYNVRIQPQTSDEVGELCHNFNELAHTLEANEQSRRQWVADISHEMRTPLAVIKAQIESMQDGIRQPSQANLALLKDKTDSLNALVNDLYELSLSDLGALTYSKEVFSFNQLFEHTQDEVEVRTNGKELTLTIENNLNEQHKIYGDSSRLAQLINNLIENSLRYTDTPGQIKIWSAEAQGNLEFHIEDSAPGVNPDQLDKIFDRLYRLDSSRNRATGGAGLGLSICKNIVEAHNGTIRALQSKLGGIHIIISLPRWTR
ncbi:ATP-binding protein [Saccharophagus degradans]|uniref:histidine kinase n=1 Tax=Saccharophagus degradans TaxID=86304 RepID=A0AAW7X7N1_9GAMM|nr:ATP-binding protein [Saccharophagus degradans]MDO6422487.1 ATP-binding protein [Saccharophagus degradans]MDO6606968.1 ATP-binding protein [Saccharophagus degradans]